jgi:excinuclease ABC subunit A
MSTDTIEIFGAYENNLKNLSVGIPANKITTVSGVSGSGKSTLARGVIYEDSQRRTRLLKGKDSEADRYLRGKYLSLRNPFPTILVPQSSPRQTEKSTVATLTGVSQLIKQHLVESGEIICTKCNAIVDDEASGEMISTWCSELKAGYEVRYEIFSNEKINHGKLKNFFDKYGVDSLFVEGFPKITGISKIFRLGTEDKYRVYAIFKPSEMSGIALEDPSRVKILKSGYVYFDFSKQTYCKKCRSVYIRKSRSLFTRSTLSEYNGACECCGGRGKVSSLDFANLFNERPVLQVFINLPHNGTAYKYCYIQDSALRRIINKHGCATDARFYELPEAAQDELKKYIRENLEKHANKTSISDYFHEAFCQSCQGSGFNRAATAVFCNGKNIVDFLSCRIDQLSDFINKKQLEKVVESFSNLSLPDIELDRSTMTLSGGELQRLKLIKYLSEGYEGHLLIIDEPSKGLSAPDIRQLFRFLRLLSKKNTLLLVDHNENVVKWSDFNLHLGPSGGEAGGFIVNQAADLPDLRKHKRGKLGERTSISGISHETVKSQAIELFYGSITSVFGVSGSGKTNLVRGLCNRLMSQSGIFDEFVLIDQRELSGNRRSSLASFLGISERLRKAFCDSRFAKLFSLTKAHFSANTKLGQCGQCLGLGVFNESTCPTCSGKRLGPLSRMVSYHGNTLPEYLAKSVDGISPDAQLFGLEREVELLKGLGLGHLTFDRELPSLSGGERQRLKLVKFLLENSRVVDSSEVRALVILDEPMRGLSGIDVDRVFGFFSKLTFCNNTVLLIEHSQDVVLASDYCIMMGPGNGVRGGKIVKQGPPSALSLEKFFGSKSIQSLPQAVSTPRDNDLVLSDEDIYFLNLRNFSRYSQISESSPRLVLGGKKELAQLLLDSEAYYFNPFVANFFRSPFICNSDIKTVLSSLRSLDSNDCYLDGNRMLFREAVNEVSCHNAWNFWVEVSDFDLAYELGFGWVSVCEQGRFIAFSTRYVDLKKRVLGDEVNDMQEEQFNFYFNKCLNCKGFGKILVLEGFQPDFSRSVLDLEFYPEALRASLPKAMFKIKQALLQFKEEGLFVCKDDFRMLEAQDQKTFLHGMPGHAFLKKKGRVDALEDWLYWPGIYLLLWEDRKKLNNAAQAWLVEAKRAVDCPDCDGKKYRPALSGFHMAGERIWEYVG